MVPEVVPGVELSSPEPRPIIGQDGVNEVFSPGLQSLPGKDQTLQL